MKNEQINEKLEAQLDRILDKMEAMDPTTPEYEILAQRASQIHAELNKALKSDMEIYKEEILADCERKKVADLAESKSREIEQSRKEGWRRFWLDLGLGIGGFLATGGMWVASLVLQDEVMQPKWYQSLQSTTKDWLRHRR